MDFGVKLFSCYVFFVDDGNLQMEQKNMIERPGKDDSSFFILQSKTLFYIFMRAVGSCNVFKIER